MPDKYRELSLLKRTENYPTRFSQKHIKKPSQTNQPVKLITLNLSSCTRNCGTCFYIYYLNFLFKKKPLISSDSVEAKEVVT